MAILEKGMQKINVPEKKVKVYLRSGWSRVTTKPTKPANITDKAGGKNPEK